MGSGDSLVVTDIEDLQSKIVTVSFRNIRHVRQLQGFDMAFSNRGDTFQSIAICTKMTLPLNHKLNYVEHSILHL